MKQGEMDAAEAGRAASCPSITFTVPRLVTGSGCPVTDHQVSSAPVRRTTKKRRNGASAQPMRIAMLGTVVVTWAVGATAQTPRPVVPGDSPAVREIDAPLNPQARHQARVARAAFACGA